eukprot:4788736-Prymnesium_polylepis.2
MDLAQQADYRTIEKQLTRAARQRAAAAAAQAAGGAARSGGTPPPVVEAEVEVAESDMPPPLLEWVEAEMKRLGNARHVSLWCTGSSCFRPAMRRSSKAI